MSKPASEKLARPVKAVEHPQRGRLPLVPPQTIAGRALVLVISIMAFLAGLTIAGVSLVSQAAQGWESEIGREVTIEVRPIDGSDMSAEVAKAVALAQEFPGVGSAHGLTDQETSRLLEPWLGAGVDLGSLPVPRLVVVTIDDPGAFSVKDLAAQVTAQVRGGSVDDHAIWVDRLAAMANSMVFAGLGVLVLMLTAMVLSIVFATRAAMAGNRDVIEVLHFCGAEDRFIAGEFQRHFLLLGMKGGAIGGGSAVAVLGLLSWWLSGAAGRPGADQIEALVGSFEIGWRAYGWIGALVVAVAALTAATSRLAVRRSLQAMA
ncbi:cell division protein FtsX [Oryzibacter oryziterrae]|uniref:cell division protein FtsX n=1 Tax=Oryzibacter oryziterrae TaxID=2766474 RepID=UPI001F3BCD5D|nr:ABC transporter permease [Oryzibacter oryziterrae]